MIEVVCNDRLGKKVRVKCNSDDTIGDLKALVEAAAGIARAHQRLTFKHAPLAIDERSLVSHGVRDGATLHLAIVSEAQDRSARAERPPKPRLFGRALLSSKRLPTLGTGAVHPT